MKTLKFLSVAAVALAIAPVFNSCKSDDAPDEPNGSEAAVIDGTHVTSINNCHIGYDQHNRPVSFTDGHDEDAISIDYNANKIYFEDGELDVKFNKNGFITEMSSSWDLKYEEDGESYHSKGSGKITCSYDKNNCLTSMKETSSETEKYSESKETYKYTRDAKTTLTWNNGNLVKIYSEEKENENGEKDEEHYTTDVEYSNDVNPYKQFPLSLLDAFEDGFDVFFAVGLFGNGPAYLPRSMSIEDEDGYTDSYNLTFSLNNNGSFNIEKYANQTWYYGYSDISRAGNFSGKSLKLNSIRNIFRHSNHKK